MCATYPISRLFDINTRLITYFGKKYFKKLPNLIQVILLKFKFSRPFKVNTQALTWISQYWESVKHQLASDESENRKQIVMSSFWKKNTLYYILVTFFFLLFVFCLSRMTKIIFYDCLLTHFFIFLLRFSNSVKVFAS